MSTHRSPEFDVLRSLIIISAIILHFNGRFDLGILALPSQFIQSYIFNVGSFFFFISGYMAHKVYLPRFPASTTKLINKGIEILFIYLAYITFMRLATGSSIPLDAYTFLFKHRFFAVVLFTFSILFLISPLIIRAYSRSRGLFLSFLIFLTGIYTVANYAQVPEDVVNHKIFGILFGVGAESIAYAIVPALIIYCIGFLAALYDKSLMLRTRQIKVLTYTSILLLIMHSSLIVFSDYYRNLSTMKIVDPFLSSILIFSSLLVIRYLLGLKNIYSILVQPEFLLIGKNTLVFYVGSNMLLGFLSLSKQDPYLTKFIVFAGLFGLTYLITNWSFRSKAYRKINNM